MTTEYENAIKNAAKAANPSAEFSKLSTAIKAECVSVLKFVAQRDASLIHYACKGIGKDDELLIKIICNRTKLQLQAADEAYRASPKNLSKKNINQKLKSELGGNYGRFMRYLVESRGFFNGKYSILSLPCFTVFIL